MKILLLNPPARDVVIRDYYCSKHTKSNYLFQPIDLLMQSGILARSCEVHAIDAVARKLSTDQCMQEIEKIGPQAVLGLWGAVTDSGDKAFYKELAARVDADLFITGEVFLDRPEEWLREHPFVKGALLRFVSSGLKTYLDTGRAGPDLVVREDGGVKGDFDPGPSQEFSLGRPLHELFGHKGYRFSFARGRRFATVLTDFGCPFKCSFCVMASLGYRLRPCAEVIEELCWLKNRGVRELFVTDQCFGARRKRSLELLKKMAAKAPGMGWTTFTRADLLDPDLVKALKTAGCHTLIMGVESADQDILEAYRKGLAMDKVRRGFELCREHKIRTVATFIIGLPEDTEHTVRATMRLARELDPDFVSYNVAVPRAATGLRTTAEDEGLAARGVDPDQAGEVVSMRTRALSRQEVAALKAEAVRDFYLRPGYLARRLMSVRSLPAFLSEAGEGVSLIRRNLGRR